MKLANIYKKVCTDLKRTYLDEEETLDDVDIDDDVDTELEVDTLKIKEDVYFKTSS